jgi:hypothetical protein
MKKERTEARKQEPSQASLREIPEVDFSKAAILGRGAAGLRRARALMTARRGRPKKGTRPDGSTPRSVRFSDALWRSVERRARARGITLHALLREVIADWLARAA